MAARRSAAARSSEHESARDNVTDLPLPPPVPVRVRADGWTGERQRTFFVLLAKTGSVSNACREARVSSRSACRLRARRDAEHFARTWDQALKIATVRLTTLAFEPATRGTVREIWKEGQLVQQTREPSDRLPVFLLQHLLSAGKPPPHLGRPLGRVRGDDRCRPRQIPTLARRTR